MYLTCCEATEIRTPDLLHAMQLKSVHSSPPAFAADTADLPFRPQGSAAVHYSSLRTVTSLVTSRPGTAAPARRTAAGYRPPAGLTGPPLQATPEPVTRRHASALTGAAEPARPGPDTGGPWRRSDVGREQRVLPGQCTPPRACRTASAHPGTGLDLVTTGVPAGHAAPGAAATRPAVEPGSRPGASWLSPGPARGAARDRAAAGPLRAMRQAGR